MGGTDQTVPGTPGYYHERDKMAFLVVESVAAIAVDQGIGRIVQVCWYVRVRSVIIRCAIAILRRIVILVFLQFLATIFLEKRFATAVIQATVAQATCRAVVFLFVVVG